jgi:hypothetical protein
MTQLQTCEAVMAWQLFLPTPERPVQKIAVLSEGKRYGGFTSLENAQWFAERLGLQDAKIIEYTGEPPCSTPLPPS